jgi:hypothetical protein
MEDRTFYVVIAIAGVAILLASIFAHQLGLGSATFGTKKIAGAIVGAVVMLAGLIGYARRTRALAR